MKGLERLAILRDISLKKRSGWIYKDIFRVLKKEDIWDFAYENVVAKNVSYLKTKNRVISEELQKQKLNNLRLSVVSQTYKPHIIRKEIKGHNEIDFHLLDTIVIKVIDIILTSIFEPLFYESNFGLLENKNEHSALEYFEKNFSVCNSVIQGNFERNLPLISNEALCNFLIKYIDDTRFLNLIRTILNTESEISLSTENQFSSLKKKA